MNTILFRTDASLEIGTGHVMRCLALAQEAHNQGHKSIFLMTAGANALKKRLEEEGCEVRELKSNRASSEDALETSDLFKKCSASCVVVDGYDFSDEYQNNLKSASVRFLLIDDYGHAKKYSADFILNQNSYAKNLKTLYSNRSNNCELLLGSEFVLLRREFKNANSKKEVPQIANSILVTLGGGDPNNITLRIIELLKQIDGINVTIIIGSTNNHLDNIKSIATKNNMKVICDTHNMNTLMANTNLAISAGGTTSYELAFMGVPTLMFVLANNQKKVVHDLDKKGIIKSLGWASECSDEKFLASVRAVLNNQQLRQNMSDKGKRLVDGNGTQRVLDKLLI